MGGFRALIEHADGTVTRHAKRETIEEAIADIHPGDRATRRGFLRGLAARAFVTFHGAPVWDSERDTDADPDPA